MNERLTAELIDHAEIVFHLAAAVGVKLIVDAPVRTIETNVHGTEVVLKHASKKRKLVVIFSTSEVYGKSTALPFREDADLVMGPTSKHRWAYACSKAIDEFLALAYWKEKKLPVIVARLFNTVGPRQTGRYGMVIPTFVRQALTGAPITVHGDGRQRRAFGYVSDVVDGLIKLVEEPRAVGEVFNIGNPEEISILDLAHRVKALASSTSDIVLIPYDQAYEAGFEDMQRRVPDLTKIMRLVGYVPTVGTRPDPRQDYQGASRGAARSGRRLIAAEPRVGHAVQNQQGSGSSRIACSRIRVPGGARERHCAAVAGT